MRLKDKVILVTGSTTGIGKAIAKRCVREGAKVVIHGLEKDLAAETLAAVGTANGVVHIEDLLSPGCPQRLVDLAVKTYGRLDGVVNNAAIIAQGNIQTTDAAAFHKMLAVNTVVPFLLIQAALPHLSKAHGAVLNIGSVNAYSGEPNLLPYSVSKGALTTLTRNLGDTLHRLNGVRVNQINPGLGAHGERDQAQEGARPQGRLVCRPAPCLRALGTPDHARRDRRRRHLLARR